MTSVRCDYCTSDLIALFFTLIVRICRNREMAEEYSRWTCFMTSGAGPPSMPRAVGSVVGWILVQARSRAIDRLRFEQRKKRVRPDSGELPEGSAEVSCPADAIDTRQRRSVLRSALMSLTADEREAIETAFFSGLTYAETATRLGRPVGTVKTRVRSGLAKLRSALGEEGER